MDRIDDYVPWQTIRARKLTSLSEEFWSAGPVAEMPLPLVLESLGQAGGWLIILSSDGARRGLLVSIGSVSFGDPVLPGDVLELEGRIDSISDDAALMSGRATVAGRTVLEAGDLMCVLVEAGTLEDPARTKATAEILLAGR